MDLPPPMQRMAHTYRGDHHKSSRRALQRTWGRVLSGRTVFAVPQFGAFPSLHVFASGACAARHATHCEVPSDAVLAVVSLLPLARIHGLSRRALAALGRGSTSILSGSTRRTVDGTRNGIPPSRTFIAYVLAACAEVGNGRTLARESGTHLACSDAGSCAQRSARAQAAAIVHLTTDN